MAVCVLWKTHIRLSTQGIMLVYDICNEKSFENIKNWIRNIEEVHASITGYIIPVEGQLNPILICWVL